MALCKFHYIESSLLSINYFSKTEKWVITGAEVSQELLDLTVTGYYSYPELFRVDKNFCDCL